MLNIIVQDTMDTLNRIEKAVKSIVIKKAIKIKEPKERKIKEVNQGKIESKGSTSIFRIICKGVKSRAKIK